MKKYVTISVFGEDEFVEKRSTFIGAALPVTSHDEAMTFIKKRKEAHRDSNHTVWAYILKDGVMRYSDDGEPQGTGGQPVLEVLKRSELVDVCIGVTRYFGGVLLGAGGLVRAYTNGAVIALDSVERVEISPCITCFVIMNYSQYQIVIKLLPRLFTEITDTQFAENVTIKVMTRDEDFKTLENQLIEVGSATIKIENCENIYAAMPPKE